MVSAASCDSDCIPALVAMLHFETAQTVATNLVLVVLTRTRMQGSSSFEAVASTSYTEYSVDPLIMDGCYSL